MLDVARCANALLAATALLAALPPTASADSYYCTIHGVEGGAPFRLCAGTDTAGEAGWTPMVLEPDAAAAAPVSASSSGSNGGAFAASATASASAEPGLLRLEASASAFGTGIARASAGAQASMYEEGTFAPLGGAAPGTPIQARLTIDVAGAFSGTPAGADGEVTVYRGLTLVTQRNLFLSFVDGDVFEEIDLPGLAVGDSISLLMRVRAFATGQDVGVTASSADLGNSAHLYLDVLSGNAAFDAASEHDYSSVPEPGGPLLVLAGAGALIGTRRRSARK
jgi:hypothetical protein